MKAKFEVGAEINFLSPDEFRDEFRAGVAAWMLEIGRGVRFRRVSGQATVGNPAAGTWDMLDQLGPEPGFVWSVTRVVVTGGGLVLGTDLWQVSANAPDPSTIIGTGFTRNAYFTVGQFVLNGGDRLRVDGVGTGAGTDVSIAVGVAELPAPLAWQLL